MAAGALRQKIWGYVMKSDWGRGPGPDWVVEKGQGREPGWWVGFVGSGNKKNLEGLRFWASVDCGTT